MYGTDSTNLTKLYSSTTDDIDAMVQTALWPLTDVIRDKQALKFGVEATTINGSDISVTVDSEYTSSPAYNFANYAVWNNDLKNPIPWTNSGNQTISWLNTGYFLYKSDSQQYGKYLGLTVTSNSAGITYNTFEHEYEYRARF